MHKLGNLPKLVPTKTSAKGSKIQIVAASVAGAAMAFFGIRAVAPISQLVCAAISTVIGYALYKMQIYGYRMSNYDSIEFSHEYFIVNFNCRESMKVLYEDVVEISPAFESMHTTLTITGDYPIFRLPLYDLENNMHKKFVKFLEDRIAGL